MIDVDRDTLIDMLPLEVPVGDCDALPESDVLVVARTDAETDGENDEELVTVAEKDGCRDDVSPQLPVEDDEELNEMLLVPVATEIVGEILGKPLGVTKLLAESTLDREAEGDAVALFDADALGDDNGDGDGEMEPVEQGDRVAISVLVIDTEGEAELEAVATPLLETLGDGLCVKDALVEGDADRDRGAVKDTRTLTDEDVEDVTETVTCGDALKLADDVSDDETLPLNDTLTDEVPENDVFALAVRERDGRAEALDDTEALCDFEISGVEETEAELFTERLCNALRDTDGDAVFETELADELEGEKVIRGDRVGEVDVE